MDIGSILTLASNAGFSGADLATAAAIALAESGGNPNDYNPETAARGGTPQGQGSFGLWQIYLKAHPEFAGQNLYDPQTNANAAYSVYSHRGGFRDWVTYSTGAYQEHLPSVLAVMQPAPTPPGQTDSTPPLVLDASTLLPVEDAAPVLDPNLYAAGLVNLSPPSNLGTYLLWAGLAIATLWIFDKAT